MKQFKLYWISITMLFALVITSCGGGGSAPVTGGDQGSGTQEAAGPVDAATAATISGKANFTGTAPEPKPILMDSEPTCQEKHPDGAFSEEVVVNSNNTLKNVFVYVKDGLGDLKFPTPQEPVVLDQSGCQYVPHVFGMQVNQTLIIRNSDGILHNIHPVPTINRAFNLGQPVKMDSPKKFDKPEMFIHIGCDVHEWMSAYVSVLAHPYYITTGDDGSFTLQNLPPGTYTVAAWHEKYGEKTTSVTVGEKETKEIEFSFEGE